MSSKFTTSKRAIGNSAAKGAAAAAGVITGIVGTEMFNKFRKPAPVKFGVLGDPRLQGLCAIAGIALPLISAAVTAIMQPKTPVAVAQQPVVAPQAAPAPVATTQQQVQP